MHIGARVAVYRKRRGLSQEALAGLVGRSRTWLSQVERGTRSADRLSTLADLAAVLRVDLADLVGEEWRLVSTGSTQTRAVDAIRQRLTGYTQLLGKEARPWPLPHLRNAVVEAHRTYQAARYESVAGMLADLLSAVDAPSGDRGIESRETQLSRCYVHALTAKLLRKLGEGHLAWLAADRASHAAMAADSAAAQGLAAYEVACALLRNGRLDEAERIAVAAAERLTGHASSNAPDEVSFAGALWLAAGVIAARRRDRSEAQTRLASAQRMADLLGRDANFGWTAFGPTNVLIHRGTVASEIGDPYRVLEAAALIDAESLPAGLRWSTVSHLRGLGVGTDSGSQRHGGCSASSASRTHRSGIASVQHHRQRAAS